LDDLFPRRYLPQAQHQGPRRTPADGMADRAEGGDRLAVGGEDPLPEPLARADRGGPQGQCCRSREGVLERERGPARRGRQELGVRREARRERMGERGAPGELLARGRVPDADSPCGTCRVVLAEREEPLAVGRKSDRKDGTLLGDSVLAGLERPYLPSRAQLPQAHRPVPAARDEALAVRREEGLADETSMPLQGAELPSGR